ncbi:uncharacterized protein MELLADRAFT_88021 [Melampsora larici-populina 98AG31]|uniref:Uncharacterized protein n=1 Tax=Melampsora larici-populina (strain 98AG31 / pathotype 3-4-7) TaxID=747676 RepID=F4RQ48_MELLP|nr:uncharacterized protein MELLADRAFT_88021 [Melampsora larici-populina 98AG31]EGG05472.1 hypothetical protein MELLADRAFT_88021 [Melampsora larici-populina 98AG31]
MTLNNPETQQVERAPQLVEPTPVRTVADPVVPENAIKSKGKSVEKEGDEVANPEEEITYVDDQQLRNNSLLKLSPCFHQKMTKLKAYVPLTVFNLDWIDRDCEKANQRKVKTVKELQEGDDTMTYSGLQPKDELLLSYGEWLDHMDLFIRYVEEYYNMPKCAENFRKHRQNVIDIRRSTSCWMIALRYCIKVRKLVMQFRLIAGKRVMSNAGVLHEDILRAAKDKVDSSGERSHAENPYVAVAETPEPSSAKERSLIKREFAAANQNGNGSGGSWRNNRGEDHHGGKRGKAKYHKNNNRNDRQSYRDRENTHGSGHPYAKGQANFGFQPFTGQYHTQPQFQYQPYTPYSSYPYASGGNQGFNQGNTIAGPSEPNNQLAIVPKPNASGSGGQGGALAIVHRNNTNKCFS